MTQGITFSCAAAQKIPLIFALVVEYTKSRTPGRPKSDAKSGPGVQDGILEVWRFTSERRRGLLSQIGTRHAPVGAGRFISDAGPRSREAGGCWASLHDQLRDRVPAVWPAACDTQKKRRERLGSGLGSSAIQQGDLDLIGALGQIRWDGDGIADFPPAW